MNTHFRCPMVAYILPLLAASAFGYYSEGILQGTTPGLYTSTMSADGHLGDWGVVWVVEGLTAQVDRRNSEWLPTVSGVSYWIEDGISCDGRVGPGYGGQNFDHEAAYLGLGQYDLNLALVTGMDKAGQKDGEGNLQYPGDIFFDTNDDGKWDFAVATRNRGTIRAGYAYGPTEAYRHTTWWTVPGWSSSAPASVLATRVQELFAVSAFIYTNATTKDDNRYPWDSYVSRDHNVIELKIPWDTLTAAGIPVGDVIHAHFTQSCGNDVLDIEGERPHVGPPQEIFEPGTAVLLIIGLAAFARRRR